MFGFASFEDGVEFTDDMLLAKSFSRPLLETRSTEKSGSDGNVRLYELVLRIFQYEPEEAKVGRSAKAPVKNLCNRIFRFFVRVPE